MRLPDFLIIGAMKAGTTTLYYDLMRHPDLYLPPENKEPHCLAHDRVRTPEGLAEYAAYFRRAAASQRCGEGSTGYAKLPDIPGVPERARELLGANLRLLYIVREPVSRIISHHRHETTPPAVVGAELTANIDRDVAQRSSFINYSRYAMQLRPWLDIFGPEQIKVIVFEEFVCDRRRTVAEVHRFLGVAPRPDLIDSAKKRNASEARPVVVGFWRAIYDMPLYRRGIRRLLPLRVRDILRETLLPRYDATPTPPSPETVDRIIDAVAPDAEQLRQLLGREKPIWDLDAVRARYAPAAVAPQAQDPSP